MSFDFANCSLASGVTESVYGVLYCTVSISLYCIYCTVQYCTVQYIQYSDMDTVQYSTPYTDSVTPEAREQLAKSKDKVLKRTMSPSKLKYFYSKSSCSRCLYGSGVYLLFWAKYTVKYYWYFLSIFFKNTVLLSTVFRVYPKSVFFWRST